MNSVRAASEHLAWFQTACQNRTGEGLVVEKPLFRHIEIQAGSFSVVIVRLSERTVADGKTQHRCSMV